MKQKHGEEPGKRLRSLATVRLVLVGVALLLVAALIVDCLVFFPAGKDETPKPGNDQRPSQTVTEPADGTVTGGTENPVTGAEPSSSADEQPAESRDNDLNFDDPEPTTPPTTAPGNNGGNNGGGGGNTRRPSNNGDSTQPTETEPAESTEPVTTTEPVATTEPVTTTEPTKTTDPPNSDDTNNNSSPSPTDSGLADENGTEQFDDSADNQNPNMAPTPPAQADGTEVGDTGSIDDGDSSDGEETGGMSVPVMVFWILCLLLAADILSIILVSMNIRRERMLLEEEREERRNGRRQELNRTARSAPSGAEQGFQTEHIQPKAVSGGKIAVGQLHNIGKRPYQEDSSGVTMLSDGALAIVADGMGGLSGGDKVSQKIVYTMLGYSDSLKTGQMDGVLSAMVNGVNESVNKMLGPDGLYKSGSTLMAVLVRQNRFHWIAVGDSHIYFYRNGSLVQLNQEHNRGQDLIVKAVRGEITFQEAREDRKKSGLTSFVGMGNLKHVDKSLRSIPLEAGDRIVLMTDGVFNALPDQTIAAVLARNPNVDQAAAEMERLVIQHGNPRQDNFTAVILGF